MAGILSASARQSLQNDIAVLEHDTSAEIAVVTVPSLSGETVEQYANALFQEWGIGKKGKNNGVLILVAPQEHRMRIEVGYGLEPVLPDGLAGEIIRQHMTPAFKEGNYDRGVTESTARVIAIIRSNHHLPSNYTAPMSDEDRFGMAVFMFFMVLMGAPILGIGFGSRTVIWFLLALPILAVCGFVVWALMGPIVQGFIAAEAIVFFILGYRHGRQNAKYGFNSKKRRYYRAWSLFGPKSLFCGSSGGSTGSSSSSSSSDFGGGTSGGGGASGSW